MSKYDVLIFDLDGTIVDSFPDGLACCLRAARKNDWPVSSETIETIRENWGISTDRLVQMCWPKNNWRIMQTALNDFNMNAPPPPLFPDVAKTLASLSQGRYIFTGRLRNGTMPLLAHHGLTDMFNRIMTRSDVFATKPDPEGLEKLIVPLEYALGYKRSGMLLVGDGYYSDGECARAAGIDFLASAESENVSRIFFRRKGISDEWIIDRFSDLPAWLAAA